MDEAYLNHDLLSDHLTTSVTCIVGSLGATASAEGEESLR